MSASEEIKPNPVSLVYLYWKGRMTRKTYWLYFLPIALIFWINEFYISTVNVYLEAIIAISLLYPSMMINIKRCHDLGKTGYFSLPLFVPVVNLWPLIELSFHRGNVGINRYGNTENL
jgi:uncharacterized membrane protein YhaH (DUF805 family)